VLGLWAIVRFAAAFTWRDARVLGPFGAEQLVLVPVAVVALCGPLAVAAIRGARRALVGRRAVRRAARGEKAAEARGEKAAETPAAETVAAEAATDRAS
jgi:hypothetical protein